jgi:hypothetical protein
MLDIMAPTAFNFGMIQGLATNAAVEPVAPGYLVEATVAPGFAGVFRISKHDGASQRPLPNGGQELVVGSAQARWYGVYSRHVFADAWEPMDQPNPAAYLPLRFSELDRKPISAHFTLLIQHAKRPTIIRRTLPRDGSDTVSFAADLHELGDACRRLLIALDLGRDEVDTCWTLLMSSL